MALSRVVSEIFNVEKCRDLEIGVKGHSRSMKVSKQAVRDQTSCTPVFELKKLRFCLFGRIARPIIELNQCTSSSSSSSSRVFI